MHIANTHGGGDNYRERTWYEAKKPRPKGMHSGPTEFVKCGRDGCEWCTGDDATLVTPSGDHD